MVLLFSRPRRRIRAIQGNDLCINPTAILDLAFCLSPLSVREIRAVIAPLDPSHEGEDTLKRQRA